MLISVLGNLGSGKTLFLAYMSSKIKREIYSNFKLNIDNYVKLEVVSLLNLPNNIDVFIDEGYTWLESRVSNKVLNRYLSYILLQSRKRTINIFITAQLFSTVDIRFRHQSDILIFCNKIKKSFQYKILNVRNNIYKNFIFPFDIAKKYYDIYDTYEIVEPYQKEQMEFTILQSDTKKLFKKAKLIAIQIKKDLKRITHNNVKLTLLKNGFAKDYEPYVYMYLKDKELSLKEKKEKRKREKL